MMEVGEQDGIRLHLDVSSQKFVASKSLLSRYPDTKLGRIASSLDDEGSLHCKFYFDADEEVFREVLRFYRSGEIHVPTNMCYQSFVQQLEFWEISRDFIGNCCQPEKQEEVMEKQFLWLERRIKPEEGMDKLSFGWHLWYFLTDPMGPYTQYKIASWCWTAVYLLFTVAQSLLYGVMTMPEVSRPYMQNLSQEDVIRSSFDTNCNKQTESEFSTSFAVMLNSSFTIFFFVEIIVRLTSCPDKKFFLKSLNLIDLIISLAEIGSFLLVIFARSSTKFYQKFCLVEKLILFFVFIWTSLRILKILRIAAFYR